MINNDLYLKVTEWFNYKTTCEKSKLCNKYFKNTFKYNYELLKFHDIEYIWINENNINE